MIELAINNAWLVDGTGGPGRRASVGVADGRIVEVATADLPAANVIDAQGEVLAPGFIDIHSHADFRVESHPRSETQLAQGVTTLVAGNCGHSPFPVVDVDALASTSSFLRPELSWNWRDLAGFRDSVAASGPGVNVALQVGHGALRVAAMGTADRPPTASELEQMCSLLREAAEQGAVGFSTGLIYVPGSYARQDEVEALVATAAECGLTYSSHVRNETDGVLGAVEEAIGTARRTGVTLQVSHIKAMGQRNHGKVEQVLELIDQAVAQGVNVGADVYPYTASSTTLASRLPYWALDGGTAELLRRLADPSQRQLIREEVATRLAGEIDPAGIVLAGMPPGKFSAAIGTSISDLAEEEGWEPADTLLCVLEEHQGAVSIINHAMAESDLEAALRHPLVSVVSDGWELAASGDGLSHPRSFGSFARVLGRYVRSKGVLSLEEAVRKMTSLPASRMAVGERGVVRPGAIADLVVFNQDTVSDHSTYADPWQLASGVSTVVLQRRVAVRGGVVLDESAGTVL